MSEKPRVLHVVDSLEIGGIERLVHDLVIARGGERTAVACLESVGPFGEELRKSGIAVELIGKHGGVISTVWRMWRYLLRARPDVLHCHNLPAFLNGALAARICGGIPVVMTKHGALDPGTGIAGHMNRWLIGRAEVIAVSREASEIMREWMGTPGRTIHYVPNGISTTAYENLPSRETARRQLGLPVGALIIGIVARVTMLKGHLLLIDVFARLKAVLPHAVLVMVGDGVGLPAARTRIRELGLEESVIVMGERQDVPIILAALDIFCLPSEMEGMPMTVLEAMAAGLPLVSSNVGGIPEIVKEGKTGLMVPPRVPDGLEAALLALAGDSDRAREMGRKGRERLLREFSLERTVAAYEERYIEQVNSRYQNISRLQATV